MPLYLVKACRYAADHPAAGRFSAARSAEGRSFACRGFLLCAVAAVADRAAGMEAGRHPPGQVAENL
eukprot:2785029-Pleurochrysis_carterae.AAC.1